MILTSKLCVLPIQKSSYRKFIYSLSVLFISDRLAKTKDLLTLEIGKTIAENRFFIATFYDFSQIIFKQNLSFVSAAAGNFLMEE